MSSYLDYLRNQHEKGVMTSSERRDGEMQYKKADYHKKRKLDKDHASLKPDTSDISKSHSETLNNEIDSADVAMKRKRANKQEYQSKNTKGSFLKVAGNIFMVFGVIIKMGGAILKGLLYFFIFITNRK